MPEYKFKISEKDLVIPKKHLRKYPLEITEKGEPHYVYFIVTCPTNIKEERRVKIGKSQKEDGVQERVKAVSTYCPVEIKLLGYLKGYEKDWHSYFADYRNKGEWFKFDGIKHYLKQIKLKIPKILLDEERQKYQDTLFPGSKNYINRSDTDEVVNLKLLQSRNMANNEYVTDRYQTRVLENAKDFDWSPYEEDEIEDEQYDEKLDNAEHVCRLLNLCGFGEIDSNNLGYNKVVRIVTANTAKMDLFNDYISEGEPYYRTDPKYTPGGYHGISLRSGEKLFRVFKNFMKVRNHHFFMDRFSGTKQYKSSNKMDEKVHLYNIVNLMGSSLERELIEKNIIKRNN